MVFPSMGQGNNASPPSSPSNTPVSSRYVCVSLYNVRVERMCISTVISKEREDRNNIW